MNKFGLSDSVIDAAKAVLDKKEVDDTPEAEKEWPFHSAVEDIPEGMEMHLKPHGTAGTHYKVHAVGKKLAAHGGIKVGETLSDTEVDDARESGIRVKHVKEDVEVEEGLGSAIGNVAGGAAKLAGKAVGATARTAGKVAGSVAGGTVAATKKTAIGVAKGAGSAVKGTAQGAGQLVKRTVQGVREEEEVDEGAMKRMATQAKLGEPGMGLDTYRDITMARKKLSPAERDALNKKDDKLPAPTKEDIDLVDQLLELDDVDFNELLDESTDEQLDELLGAMARGAGNLMKRGAKAAGSLAMKGAKAGAQRMSVQGRADAAEKKTQKIQDKTKAVQDKMAARKKLGQQKAAASLAKQKLKAIKNQAKDQRANMNKPQYASEETEAVEEVEIDEVSSKKASDYMVKAANALNHRGLPTKKVDNRYAGVRVAHDKLAAAGKLGTTAKKQAKVKVPASEEIEESVGLSTGVMSFLDDYEDIMEKKLSSKEKMKRGLYNERNLTMKAPKMDFKQGIRGKGKLDPVGQADKDIDNDGDVDSSDSYLHNRRKAIKKAMKEASNDKEKAPFEGGKPIPKKRLDKFGNVIKDKNAAKHLAKMAMKQQTKEDYDPLLEGAGDEEPNSAGNAASLAKHYQEKSKKAAEAGNSEVAAKMANVAKKFYNKSDHMAKREKEGRGSKAESFEPETFWSDAEIEFFEGIEDNPANVQHMCMKQVAHEQYGEGECVHGEHADPVDGEVAWYSVQFEHGIEIVDSGDLEVISEMNHGHKKKKMKEDYTPNQQEVINQIEEARKGGGAKVGETERSGIRVTKSSKEEPEHIAMQLRKVISVGAGHDGVHFDNGGKQKVHKNVAQAALSRYNKAKPAEKEEMQKHMKHSHKALSHVAGGHDLSKSPAAEKKNKLEISIDKTQSRRHGVRSASGHYN